MKNEIRKEMITKRNELSDEECFSNSQIIIEKLDKYLKEHHYKNILIYMDMKNEVMATLLLDYDYNIYITKTMEDNTLQITKYDTDKMSLHPFGYYECHDTNYIDGNLINAVIIPGVAFDLKGNRVGFGKGYYDRFLAQYPTLPRIALAHDFQISERAIPIDKYDQQMNMIFTEKRTINF